MLSSTSTSNLHPDSVSSKKTCIQVSNVEDITLANLTVFALGEYLLIFSGLCTCLIFNTIPFSDKDIDCDIRENIINYEDEGGGEGDQTGYDLSVLRMMSDGTNGMPHLGNGGVLTALAPNDKGKMMALEAAPDIQTFLQTNKVRKS